MAKTESAGTVYLSSLPGIGQLEADLAKNKTHASSVGFLCYDIVQLRRINHVYGREIGDALLAAVAQWVLRFSGGRLYRAEGDLFCLMFPQEDLKKIRHNASLLDARFARVWHLEAGGRHADVYAQAAIAVLGDLRGGYHRELLDLFERALELSRTSRQIAFFDAERERETRQQMHRQMELKTCIFSGMLGFSVMFQPIADAATGTWCGLEALCRWDGPTVGPVLPDVFIPEVEDMGLIYQLGNWVLNEALAACKAMGLEKLPRFFLTVNVSALQLVKRGYVRTVIDAMEKHQFPYEKLVLEITESTRVAFTEETVRAIEMLRAKGVRFALDDFGSGYSGFSNLKNLPADILKTDRDFINDIENDVYLQYFYYIMSETVHANRMYLVAEGIETNQQLRSVVKNGVDLIQGFLFGHPMTPRDVAARKENFTCPLQQFTGWGDGTFDFKQWINGQSAYKITPALFRLQSTCIGIILDEADPEAAVDRILELVGRHFKVGRVYVFVRTQGTVFHNLYEWCAEGVTPQIHLFQNVDASLDGFYELLCENEVVIATSEEQLPGNMRQRLQEGGQAQTVQAMVVMPMKQRGEIFGFVGFDDATKRDWLPEELIMLYNLCLLCLITLAKKEGGR